MIIGILQLLLTAISSGYIIANQWQLIKKQTSNETKLDLFIEQTNRKLDEIKKEQGYIEDDQVVLDKRVTGLEFKIEILTQKVDRITNDLDRKN